MEKIPKNETWLTDVIDNLRILLQAFDDNVIPTMIYDGDAQDKAGEIRELINYLQKTN